MFQNPFTGTAADLTVAENLMLASRRGSRRGLSWALAWDRRYDIRDRVARLGMGLEQRLDTPIGMLSGGQRQALTVIMATIVRPSLLLLDEHTAALDPRSAEIVTDLTREVIVDGGLTTLMVTHDVDEALFLSDRVVMMTNGPEAEVGDVLPIPFPRPRDRKAILEHPDYYRYREHLIEFLAEKAHRRPSKAQTSAAA